MAFYFVPFHNISCPVRTKHGITWIVRVGVAVISYALNYFIGIVAWLISFKRAVKPAFAVSVLHNFLCVIIHSRYGSCSVYHGKIAHGFGSVKTAAHSLNIRYSPAHIFVWYFQRKLVNRLQQQAVRTAKPLPHSSVSSLPEIAAFSMLRVCSA